GGPAAPGDAPRRATGLRLALGGDGGPAGPSGRGAGMDRRSDRWYPLLHRGLPRVRDLDRARRGGAANGGGGAEPSGRRALLGGRGWWGVPGGGAGHDGGRSRTA